MIIKNNNYEVSINEVGATIDSFVAYGIDIANKGMTVGRYANRIAKARFVIDGKEYQLSANEKGNLLHGGADGFGNRPWTVDVLESNRAVFSIESPDLDQGFPGNLKLSVEFKLEDDGLAINYEAVCDKDCHVNFTNHMYFNLNGDEDVYNHKLWINSDTITEVDDQLITTGKFLPVAGTKFDYINERKYEGGLDINYVVKGEGYRLAAVLTGLGSGIVLKCMTTEPGLQVYNTKKRICLETQHYPDSPNHDNFPSSLLKANQKFTSSTKYIVTK